MGDNTARDLGRVSLNPLVHIDLFGTVLIPLIQLFGPPGSPSWDGPSRPRCRPGTSAPASSRKGQILVAGAGPVSNLILAAGVHGRCSSWRCGWA